MERPSRRARINPAFERRRSCADKVFGAVSRLRAISPAARPSGPALTNRRNTCSRASCASAERRLTASFNSIFQISMNYRIMSSPLCAHKWECDVVYGAQKKRPRSRGAAFMTFRRRTATGGARQSETWARIENALYLVSKAPDHGRLMSTFCQSNMNFTL